jgi:hypothetical protein
MAKRKEPRVYKIIFRCQGETLEIYTESVTQSELYGFIEIGELVFGERSQLLVDPTEERLKSEFASVKSSLIPMHHVERIDIVDKQGVATIREASETKITPLPLPPKPRR